MSYTKDYLWKLAKTKYKGSKYANNWVYIVTYYNYIGGNTLSMICVPEINKSVRILGKLDNKDKVLVLTEDGSYEYYSTNEILIAPKEFKYTDEQMTEIKKYKLDTDTILGNNYCTYYVKEEV